MNKIFAERLKELREESGLSIQSLAKKINLVRLLFQDGKICKQI